MWKAESHQELEEQENNGHGTWNQCRKFANKYLLKKLGSLGRYKWIQFGNP